MFKNVRLVIIFHIFLNPGVKVTTSFANVAGTTTSTRQVNLYTREDFQTI